MSTSPPPPIRTLNRLRTHLQTALEIEHATIPPYFTAWLSANQDFNTAAAELIRSVMLEEMLHLTLAANLLNAVGGKPSLTFPGFVPRYPHRLPHSGRAFEVSVERLSRGALDTFLKIEQPEERNAVPEPDEYCTIGQFYGAVADGLILLCDELGESAVFTGDPALQVLPDDYYGSGSLIAVGNLASSLLAVGEIKEQGEGVAGSIFDEDAAIITSDSGHEPAHYFRFKELQLGRKYAPGDTLKTGPTGPRIQVDFDSVLPIRSNQTLEEFEPGSEIRGRLEGFCDSYRLLLVGLEEAFTGKQDRLVECTARMFDLKNQGMALMRTPSAPHSDTNVGLVFTR